MRAELRGGSGGHAAERRHAVPTSSPQRTSKATASAASISGGTDSKSGTMVGRASQRRRTARTVEAAIRAVQAADLRPTAHASTALHHVRFISAAARPLLGTQCEATAAPM